MRLSSPQFDSLYVIKAPSTKLFRRNGILNLSEYGKTVDGLRKNTQFSRNLTPLTPFFTPLAILVLTPSSVLTLKNLPLTTITNGSNIVGQQLPKLFDAHVASVCTPCCMWLRVVGSCCAKLETGQTFSCVQTDDTTPNIIGPTMLGILVSVCRQLYI